MVRLLVIISVTGLLLSTICLSAAAALGGRDVLTNGWSWKNMALRIDDETGDVSFEPAEKGKGGIFINGERVDDDGNQGSYGAFWVGPTETREFAWVGASEVDMGMPADVIYTQGPVPKVVVTAPTATLDRFHIDEEKFRLHGWAATNTFRDVPTASDLQGARPPRVKIEITAPGVTRFDFSGSETLDIKNYAQDSLTLDFSGASKVTAQGAVRLLVLDLSGAADAELANLSAETLSADLSGASQATVAPKSSANIDASGTSRVTLTTNPKQVTSDLSGKAVMEGASGTSMSPLFGSTRATSTTTTQ